MTTGKIKPEYGNTWERETSDEGEFVRKQTHFRHCIRADGSTPFPPRAGRYHLYISYACPWAHRTLIVRKLKGLEDAISYDVVDWLLGPRGWSFESTNAGTTGDRVNGFEYLREAYTSTDADYNGAVTVPTLWDKQSGRIVNNESAEIIRMFNHEFQEVAANPNIDLYPEHLQQYIDELNDWIYPKINNGVYRCGFARKQGAYSRAFQELFEALDQVEEILSGSRYLTGAELTEADVRLFTTLVRFDPVYFTHFKCNQRRIVEYPNTWGYVRDIYQLPGVAETVNMEHIKHHYFVSHRQINPFGIVPDGPDLDLEAPHDRETLT